MEDPEQFRKRFLPSACGFRAPEIRFIDRRQNYADYLCNQNLSDAYVVPLGWYTQSIQPYCLSLFDTFCYAISDVSGEGAHSMLENLLYALQKQSVDVRLIGDPEHFESAQNIPSFQSQEEISGMMQELLGEFQTRIAVRKAYREQYGAQGLAEYLKKTLKPLVVLVENYSAFCEITYATPKEGQRGYRNLVEEYLRNGSGLGVAFIAAFDATVYTQWWVKNAVKLFVSGKNGVHVGGQLSQQKLMQLELPTREQTKIREPESGFAVENGKINAVYIPAHIVPEQEE